MPQFNIRLCFQTQKHRPRRKQRGAVALEFALISFALLIAMIGMVELSRAIMVHQVFTNVAREAARRAIVPDATEQELYDIMQRYASSAGISATITASVTVDKDGDGTYESSYANVSSHDAIKVDLSVPFADVSWGFLRFMPSGATINAGVITRKE